MSDQRAQYNEEAVGANHPTKADVVNRLTLVDHGTDGQHTLAGYQGSAYAADAEASDTYVITLDPVPAAYFNGMVVVFKANTANTGAATLNVNGKGAIAVTKYKDQALADGDILAGQIVVVVYNSTGPRFEMVTSPSMITVANDIEVTDATKGLILKNSDGTRYRLTLDTDANSGAIIITPL